MKKSTLLSLLTTAAIITTTAGTYAAWDQLSDKATSKVKFNKPVTIKSNNNLNLEVTPRSLGETVPSATSSVSFTIANEDNLADTLTITPTFLTKDTKKEIDREKFEIVIHDNDSNLDLTGNRNIFTDDTLASANYTITIKPKYDEVSTVAGQEFDVELTASLSKEKSE